MREILFRAKEKYDGDWVEGLLGFCEGKYLISDMDGIGVFVDESTISEYTGLCDKNGNKIFENDIVDMNRKGCGFKRIEKVFYEEGGFSPISVHGWECTPEANEIEVIGNIFDNPELLEGGN